VNGASARHAPIAGRGRNFAPCDGMAISTQLSQYAGRRITRRLMRSMPWIGGVLALAMVGSAIRRKGVLGGTVDTALDFIPFVGGMKNLAEAARGRDFIPSRIPAGARAISAAARPDGRFER
jgi:hypothetical protein